MRRHCAGLAVVCSHWMDVSPAQFSSELGGGEPGLTPTLAHLSSSPENLQVGLDEAFSFSVKHLEGMEYGLFWVCT